MAPALLSHLEMPIESEDDVVLVRREVRSLAERRGFDAFAIAAVTTATSELARNAWVHAKSGKAIIEEIENAGRIGIKLRVEDQGPGIVDVERVLAGGYSTANSLGLGVSGTKRLVDEFDLESI